MRPLHFKFKPARKKNICKTSPDVPSPICNCLKFALPILVPHADTNGRGRKCPPDLCSPRKRGQGSPPSMVLVPAQMLSLFSKLAANLCLFKVKLAVVKANGCPLCRQLFLKDQNIQELICELFFLPCWVK